MIDTEFEIQRAYEPTVLAERYVTERFTSELHGLLHERQVATVQQLIDRGRPERILEIAPGPGRITRDLRTNGTLACLEFNDAMIAEGRRACQSQHSWIRGNGFVLPFGTHFDLAYSFRFVRHFRFADRLRLYEQVHRVLRPNGIFVLDAVNERISSPLRHADPSAYPIYDKLYRDETEVQRELEQAGFSIVAIHPVQRWYTAQHRAQVLFGPRSPWLCRKIIHGLERLRKGPALEWIVTCRRV